MLSRRTFIKGAVAAGAAGCLHAADGPPNVILICCDTWRADYLGCYGNQQIQTPSVDALAAKSAVFLAAYAEALPAVPARRTIHTGRRTFPGRLAQTYDSPAIRGWHPLYVEDITLSEAMRDAGYTTGLVSDLLHTFKPGYNFHRGYMTFDWIRGQEGDPYETGPKRGIDYSRFLHPSQLSAGAPAELAQYLINRQFWKTEDDWPAARTFREAGQWLQNNVPDSQPFFLQIETFSPHEMWDPPEDYYRLYMKSDYSGPRLIAPPTSTKALTPVELEHIRALYAGMVTFTDAHIGRFLAQADQLGLMSNTIIVFHADHGCLMGEQGVLRKAETELRTQVTRVPLIIYSGSEQWAPVRIGGLVQHTDLMPTVLELTGAQIPARVTGESLAELARSGGPSRRDRIVTGWGDHGAIRGPDWLYQGRWNEGTAVEELYDLQRDPLELVNVADGNPALVKGNRAWLKDYADSGWGITDGTFTQVMGLP